MSSSGENAEPSMRRATTTSSSCPHSQHPTVVVRSCNSPPAPPTTTARRSHVGHSYDWRVLTGVDLRLSPRVVAPRGAASG